jgi:hypothetical protein
MHEKLEIEIITTAPQQSKGRAERNPNNLRSRLIEKIETKEDSGAQAHEQLLSAEISAGAQLAQPVW